MTDRIELKLKTVAFSNEDKTISMISILELFSIKY